ncbi:unnamed protein product, partial [Polarella glacialis]
VQTMSSLLSGRINSAATTDPRFQTFDLPNSASASSSLAGRAWIQVPAVQRSTSPNKSRVTPSSVVVMRPAITPLRQHSAGAAVTAMAQLPQPSGTGLGGIPLSGRKTHCVTSPIRMRTGPAAPQVLSHNTAGAIPAASPPQPPPASQPSSTILHRSVPDGGVGASNSVQTVFRQTSAACQASVMQAAVHVARPPGGPGASVAQPSSVHLAPKTMGSSQ